MHMFVSRRTVVTALGASVAALAAPLVQAQAPTPRVATVGWLSLASTGMYADLTARGYGKGLAEGGYVEGRNLKFERRSAEGDVFKLRALARELVAAKVDVIFAPAKILADAAWAASTTIPTVIATVTDPVKVDYALSLARPGKHITGVTTASAELIGKRLQLLADMVPGLRRVAIPIDPDLLASCSEEVDLMDKAARILDITLVRVPIKSGALDVEAAVRQAVSSKAQAIMMAPMTSNYDVTDKIAAQAKRHRMPFLHDVPQLAGDGLAVYGPDFEDLFRRAGLVTARILKGERPAEMPIEEPRVFHFIVNSSTAKALGLTLAPTVLLRADKVIE
jgi:putative ABC transport system substrate-binding protein